ncbi:MAG: hypothetical protein OIF40_08070, partial [Mangrovicoccus sp.]|nr:hypothetical protein [Mangrovicoccus sp.]
PVDGLVITGNTLLHMRNETAPNPFNKPPQILLEGPSQNVTLTDNLAGRITADDTRPGWEVSGNIALAAADYGLHFAGIDPAAPPQSMADVLDAYRLVPESPLAGQVGSELLWPLPEPEPEPTLPPPPPPDPALSLVGGRDDDLLTGDMGDDTLLLRFGQDSALGGAGADTFVLDWRYLDEGDAHHIADLDFAESDQILLRFLNGSTITIPSQEALERFLESDAAQITQDGALYIQDHEGRGLSLHLEDIPLPPPPPPAPPPEPGQKLIAGRKDDQLTGGAGDDTLLLRFGQDSALGGTGADTFVLDWRYLNEGDAHHIADLDFAEGDRLVLRFFNGG